MGSQEVVLLRDILIDIFVGLDAGDLSRARAVCRAWQEIVDQEQVQREAFRRSWALRKVLGTPRRQNLFFVAQEKHFVRQHVCAPTDSLMGLALKYNIDVVQIRMINNIMSDISLRSRHHIYIPVAGPDAIAGKFCRFIYDAIPIRELVVVADTEEDLLALPDDPFPKQLQDAKISSMLAKGLKVDEDTAKYYLEEAGGDLKQVFQMFEEDSRWEAEQAQTMSRRRGQPRLDVMLWLDECHTCD